MNIEQLAQDIKTNDKDLESSIKTLYAILDASRELGDKVDRVDLRELVEALEELQ